jgi:hypothetical protein
MLFNEENVVVLMKDATPEDLHRAANLFDKKNQYDTYVFGGEALVDLLMLNENQKQEIRIEFGYPAVFSDGSGEAGDIALYLSGEVELLDDGSLIATGYTFITEDKNQANEDDVDNFAYATPHPTPDQVRNLFVQAIAKAA